MVHSKTGVQNVKVFLSPVSLLDEARKHDLLVMDSHLPQTPRGPPARDLVSVSDFTSPASA